MMTGRSPELREGWLHDARAALRPPSTTAHYGLRPAGPIEPMLEYEQSTHPFRQDLIGGAITMTEGMVRIPSGSGLGIEGDRDILERDKRS